MLLKIKCLVSRHKLYSPVFELFVVNHDLRHCFESSFIYVSQEGKLKECVVDFETFHGILKLKSYDSRCLLPPGHQHHLSPHFSVSELDLLHFEVLVYWVSSIFACDRATPDYVGDDQVHHQRIVGHLTLTREEENKVNAVENPSHVLDVKTSACNTAELKIADEPRRAFSKYERVDADQWSKNSVSEKVDQQSLNVL